MWGVYSYHEYAPRLKLVSKHETELEADDTCFWLCRGTQPELADYTVQEIKPKKKRKK